MQGLLQADRPQGPHVRVSRGAQLYHRQAAEEPVSVLSLPEVFSVRHEAGGGAGGATTCG